MPTNQEINSHLDALDGSLKKDGWGEKVEQHQRPADLKDGSYSTAQLNAQYNKSVEANESKKSSTPDLTIIAKK